MEIPRKNQKESLKIKSTATEMKKVFDRLISELNIAEERISEPVDISKTEKQREKGLKKKKG